GRTAAEARRPAAERRRRTGGAEPGRRRGQVRYVLRLYVTGTSRLSRRAVERVRHLCESKLQGRYDLEVIDIYQLPSLAKDEQIVATPTLIRVLPAPLRRFIGDLAKADAAIFGLDLRERNG
ncbi:MAG TPA: circadian clock KaiB family protein, partial [Anaeromyxobacter sp.]|nr:circadian clock KaiB family protein [Anaeromyxobacter sp.]